MVTVQRVEDGTRFVAARARRWLAAADATAAAPAASTHPIIDLSGVALDRPTPPHIIAAAVEALDRGETHYTHRPGIFPLRQAIARRLTADGGVQYDPQHEILISSGGQEGLYVATQMLVQPDDDVLVADPGYPAYREAVRLAGGNVVSVPVTAATGYAMTAEAIAARLTPATRLLVLVSPGNPTGGVTSRAEMERIATLAVAYDLKVLFDETYKTFVFDDAEHTHIAALPGMRGRTISVGSFSKTYAMPGWRVGYVVGEAHLLHPITDLKLALSICSAAVAQWAAVAALDGPQDAVAQAHAEVAKRRAALLPALTAMGLVHGDPRGAYYALADVRGLGRSSADCAASFLTHAGVRVIPGDAFGPGGEGFVRFSLTAPAPLIAEAMHRLAPLVDDLRKDARA